MPNQLVFGEGHHLDDNDNIISTIFVDLRDPAERVPITTLIKGCELQHAIELCNRVLISKPERFRESGEHLIRDPGEASVSYNELVAERINYPEDLAEEQLLSEELTKASELAGSNTRFSTRSTNRKHSRTHSLTFGKNGWIYCTSIAPIDKGEKERWKRAMPDEYDHGFFIYRPRAFARALASMVAEQLGPRGKEVRLENSFGGEHKLRTNHRSQCVFHGPVIYVDDPYEVLASATSKSELMCLPAFVKGIEFRDQREYRFAIWAEEEPPEETELLKASPAMFGTLLKDQDDSAHEIPPTVTQTDQSSNSDPEPTEFNHDPDIELEQEVSNPIQDARPEPSLLNLVNDPSVPVVPHKLNVSDPPEDLHELTTIYSSLIALRNAVERLPRDRQAASSAWHAEPCIRQLCSAFEDPIEHFRISEDNFVVVTVRFPEGCKSEARVAVGPLGTGTYRFKADLQERHSLNGDARWMGESIVKHLKELALRARRDSSVQVADRPCESG